MRFGLAAAADATTGLHAGLAAAQELADGNGFTIAADGTVEDGGAVVGAVAAGDGARAACGPRSWTGSSRCCARPVRSTRSSRRCYGAAAGAARPGPVRRSPSAFSRHPAAAVAGQRGLVVRSVVPRAATCRRRAPRVDRQPRRDPGGCAGCCQPAPARRAGGAARRRPACAAGPLRRADGLGPRSARTCLARRARRAARPARGAAPPPRPGRRRCRRGSRYRPHAPAARPRAEPPARRGRGR